MTDYHESWEALPESARDLHRALNSLKEEVEAIDWYHQRLVLATDDDLRAVLAHNRDEEMEHACMSLEWLRRRMPGWDDALRTYLFTSAPIVKVEAAAEAGDDTAAGANHDGVGLGIGKPRGDR